MQLLESSTYYKTYRHFEMKYLRDRVLGLWKLRGTPNLIHIGLGFHIVYNLTEEDRVRILTS